jgi:hypothetical protein
MKPIIYFNGLHSLLESNKLVVRALLTDAPNQAFPFLAKVDIATRIHNTNIHLKYHFLHVSQNDSPVPLAISDTGTCSLFHEWEGIPPWLKTDNTQALFCLDAHSGCVIHMPMKWPPFLIHLGAIRALFNKDLSQRSFVNEPSKILAEKLDGLMNELCRDYQVSIIGVHPIQT